jgi:hypothetical protein
MPASSTTERRLMLRIIADPPSRSCYHLLSGAGIQEFQRLGPDAPAPRAPAREKSFKAGRPAKSTAVRCNPNLNSAADSLQIAQLTILYPT